MREHFSRNHFTPLRIVVIWVSTKHHIQQKIEWHISEAETKTIFTTSPLYNKVVRNLASRAGSENVIVSTPDKPEGAMLTYYNIIGNTIINLP